MSINEDLYKTETCKNWSITGSCTYGTNCKFAHGPGELVPRQHDIKYKTRLCNAKERGLVCPYGIRCKYAHNLQELHDPQELHEPETPRSRTPHAKDQPHPKSLSYPKDQPKSPSYPKDPFYPRGLPHPQEQHRMPRFVHSHPPMMYHMEPPNFESAHPQMFYPEPYHVVRPPFEPRRYVAPRSKFHQMAMPRTDLVMIESPTGVNDRYSYVVKWKSPFS